MELVARYAVEALLLGKQRRLIRREPFSQPCYKPLGLLPFSPVVEPFPAGVGQHQRCRVARRGLAVSILRPDFLDLRMADLVERNS